MNVLSIKTRKELGIAYGFSKDSLRKRLARIGITHSYLLTPKEIQHIIDEWGAPVIEIYSKNKTNDEVNER